MQPQLPTPSNVLAQAQTGQINYVKFEDSINIPITDGEYFTDDLSAVHSTGVFIVAFYDVNNEIITPSAGTVDHAMSPVQGQWQESSSSPDPIDATTCGPDATYEVPTYLGPAIKGRIELAGIAGAEYCRAYFWRS